MHQPAAAAQPPPPPPSSGVGAEGGGGVPAPPGTSAPRSILTDRRRGSEEDGGEARRSPRESQGVRWSVEVPAEPVQPRRRSRDGRALRVSFGDEQLVVLANAERAAARQAGRRSNSLDEPPRRALGGQGPQQSGEGDPLRQLRPLVDVAAGVDGARDSGSSNASKATAAA